jgi:hypothetical protein
LQVEAPPRHREVGSARPPLPAILVSRLGVDTRWQHRGLGTSLMVHAMALAANAAPRSRRPIAGRPRRERSRRRLLRPVRL